MKRFFVLIGVCGVVVSLFAGCRKEQPPQPLHIAKKPVTNAVPPPPPPKPEPIKPAKEILPGTLAYLDSRNGFRDVTFGQMESSIANLVLRSNDEARQIKTFTRSSDELSFEGMLLESIEYSFFKGQLLEVQVKWNLSYEDSAIALPPASDMSSHCTVYYGPPTSNRVSARTSEYVWRGHQAELLLVELRLPGVRDRVTGGWTIPPRTTGRIAIRSLPLARVARAAFVNENAERLNGL